MDREAREKGGGRGEGGKDVGGLEWVDMGGWIGMRGEGFLGRGWIDRDKWDTE